MGNEDTRLQDEVEEAAHAVLAKHPCVVPGATPPLEKPTDALGQYQETEHPTRPEPQQKRVSQP